MRRTVRIDCDICGRPYSIELCDVADLASEPLLRGRLMRGAVNFALCPHCGDEAVTDHPFLVLDPVAEHTILFIPRVGAEGHFDAALLRNHLSIYQAEDPRPYLEHQLLIGDWSQLVALLGQAGE